MKKYIYSNDAQIRLLGEIFGDKAIVNSRQSNRRKRRKSIRNVLLQLPEKQREVILYQYGFTDGNTHTLEQVAGHFEISQAEAEQIKALALRTLRCPACSGGLKDLLLML